MFWCLDAFRGLSPAFMALATLASRLFVSCYTSSPSLLDRAQTFVAGNLLIALKNHLLPRLVKRSEAAAAARTGEQKDLSGKTSLYWHSFEHLSDCVSTEPVPRFDHANCHWFCSALDFF